MDTPTPSRTLTRRWPTGAVRVPEVGHGLQSEPERWLTEEHIGRPVVVMNYPKDIGLYMRMNDDGKTVAAMDAARHRRDHRRLQREERLDVLDARLMRWLDKADYWWYYLRKYAPSPMPLRPRLRAHPHLRHRHGHVRDVIPFPRTPKNARLIPTQRRGGAENGIDNLCASASLREGNP